MSAASIGKNLLVAAFRKAGQIFSFRTGNEISAEQAQARSFYNEFFTLAQELESLPEHLTAEHQGEIIDTLRDVRKLTRHVRDHIQSMDRETALSGDTLRFRNALRTVAHASFAVEDYAMAKLYAKAAYQCYKHANKVEWLHESMHAGDIQEMRDLWHAANEIGPDVVTIENDPNYDPRRASFVVVPESEEPACKNDSTQPDNVVKAFWGPKVPAL